MARLVLVAAGGLARETLAALGPGHDVVLLDDDPARRGTSVSGVPVVGGTDEITRYVDRGVVVCVGRGAGRRAVVARLTGLGVAPNHYTSVVHPSVDMPAGCTVGAGSILLAGVVLTADVSLGRHVVAMPHVTFTHDDVVEDFATFAAGVTLGGGVHVGEAAYLGMQASVRENLTVGADATLGMAAALLHDLPVGETWAGGPAGRLPSEGRP